MKVSIYLRFLAILHLFPYTSSILSSITDSWRSWLWNSGNSSIFNTQYNQPIDDSTPKTTIIPSSVSVSTSPQQAARASAPVPLAGSLVAPYPGLKNLDKMIAVTFVNGIYHSYEECQNLSRQFERSFGLKVYPFYNPSTGSWVKDFSRASFDLVLRSNDLILAKNLTDHFRQVFQRLEPKGRILHLAHSGGAILTYLAAKHHLTIGETKRIDIITFGGGKSITRKYFPYGRVCNYYSRNDPLTLIDPRTNHLLKIYESDYWIENETYGVIQEYKHNTTFIFLEAQANHPLMDHSMFGPTYQYAIELEAMILRQKIQRWLQQEEKERKWSRKIRKISANITGLHHFWEWKIIEKYYENSTYHEFYFPWSHSSLFRKLRKQVANWTNLHGYFSGKYHDEPFDVSDNPPEIINEVTLLPKSSNDSVTIAAGLGLSENPEERQEVKTELRIPPSVNSTIPQLMEALAEDEKNNDDPNQSEIDFNYLSFSSE